MPGLFISYRRDDQAGFAGRLADALGAAFGADTVFRDIEDIRPGDDFVAVLEAQLTSVEVILVVIGPVWLTASKNGVRRLDAADDFVRMEIEAGLQSGKPVLPVLVGGAAMPGEKDLPASLVALARRQAFVLSDASWTSDVARLVDSIRGLLPGRRRLAWRVRAAWAVAALAAIAVLALALKAPSPERSAATARQASPAIAQAVSGRWTSRVSYDWGAVHEETFVLSVENGEVHGTATYLGLPRSIERGQLDADRLTFTTHSEEALGGLPNRQVTHRYRGVLKNDELRFLLESSGGHSTHIAVEFLARRAAN
jgi:hypothetical protein